MRLRLLLPLLALLPACEVATGPLTEPDAGTILRVDRSAYQQGDTARLTLRNDTNERMGYHLCFSSREVRTATGWARITPRDRVCTAELRSLQPGAEDSYREPITSEWRPGEYRVVTIIEHMTSGGRMEVYTQTFTVER